MSESSSFPVLAAADWFEILAALIFFLITGLGQWIQKRASNKPGLPTETDSEPSAAPGETPAPTPPPIRSDRRVAPAPEDWEGQLRRLLQGEPATPPPLPMLIPAPRPPIAADLPPRVGRGEHDESGPSWEEMEAPRRPLATLPRADAAAHRGERLEADTGNRMAGISQLSAATQAYGHAANLHDAVAARMRDVLSRTDAPSSMRPSSSAPLRASPTAAATRNLLREPATLRQVFVASAVLGRPKALEE